MTNPTASPAPAEPTPPSAATGGVPVSTEHTTDLAPRVHLSPGERLLPYQDLLQAQGWTIRLKYIGHRARLEAFHPDGAAVMATAVRDTGGQRRRNAFYVLHAPEQGVEFWIAVRKPAFEHFAASRSLPVGTRTVKVPSRCRCGKTQFATHRRGKDVMHQVQDRQSEAGEGQPVGRVYRCPDDDRSWHLTRSPRWNGPQPQVLWASAATATPRKAPPND